MSENSYKEAENSEFDEDSPSNLYNGEILTPIGSQDQLMADTEEYQSQTSESDSEDEQQIINTGGKITQSKGRKVNKDERITPPFLTKYVRARIIGTRALQITKNSPVYVDPRNNRSDNGLLNKNLMKNNIPFIIRRYLPNGNFEDLELQELESLD